MDRVPQADNSDLNVALRLIGTRALVLTGGTSAAIALAHKGSMICRASVGSSAPPLGCRLEVTSGFSGECVRTGKALRCDDSEIDPRVDVSSCRRLGIRAILAAPIPLGQDVVGLLEVFSPEPFAFDDGHLFTVERLAQSALLPPVSIPATPPPKLLVDLEPAYRVFFRNLHDTLLCRRTTPAKLNSPPALFWADVFVPSELPWRRFVQSMVLHVIVLAALGSFLQVWVSQRNAVRRLAFHKSDVLYYLPPEYRRAKGRESSQRRKGQEFASAEQPGISVRGERDSHTQTIVAPPDVKLKADPRRLGTMAWSSIVPPEPLMAMTQARLNTPLAAALIVVAPPPGMGEAVGFRNVTGIFSTAVIGPPPASPAISMRQALTAPTPAVVGPPPSIHQSVREIDGIDIGYLEVVGPAPQLNLSDRPTVPAIVQATLRGAATSVVPPPPTVRGSGYSLGREVNSPSVANTQVALPPAIIQSASAISRIGGPPVTHDADSSNLRSPGETTGPGRGTFGDTKEVSVNVMGLALALPSSSYFSSYEVFIAKARFSRYQSRLIKLVYEFLPYQRRLSDYGPNYFAVDKLRVTRDPTCDETLAQVESSVQQPGSPHPDRLQQALHDSGEPESRLQCYRTTADDYLRARTRHH
jgi:hypothetical protein